MNFLSQKNQIFITRLTLIFIVILKIKICLKIDSSYYNDQSKEKFGFPLNNKINDSINYFVKSNSNINALIIYGGFQSGKSYVSNQIKEILINDSYFSYSLSYNCSNSSISNKSIEIFINSKNNSDQVKTQNHSINIQTEVLRPDFNICDSRNLTNFLKNVSINNKIFVSLHEFNKNDLEYLNITTSKFDEFENVSLIVESSDYNFLFENNSNISVITTDPINNTAFLLSKQYNFLSSEEAQTVEKLFGGNIGPIIKTIDGVKKGEKFNNVISSIDKEIRYNLTKLTRRFNFTNENLSICKSSIEIISVNSSQLNPLGFLFEKGYLYVNESNYINFANPTVKEFLCQNCMHNESKINGEKINSTEVLNNEFSNATNINETDNFTSNSIEKEVNLTNDLDSQNLTDNFTILLSKESNETKKIINNEFNDTSAVNVTENVSNKTLITSNETNTENIISDVENNTIDNNLIDNSTNGTNNNANNSDN